MGTTTRLPAILLLSLTCLVISLNVAESRTSGHFHWYYPFVFGNSFADTGNTGESNLSAASRQWYSPYGRSRLAGRPTGRFSDGLVQSDLFARILGRSEAPVAYRLRAKDYAEASGINFAVAGAGVYTAPTLAKQIYYFRKMIEEGTVGEWQLKNSVALVAVSGNDYARITDNSSNDQILNLAGNVTDEIARGVKRLRKLGVTKILVNALHPLGCTPSRTRPLNYTECDNPRGNQAPFFHNMKLREKLDPASSDGVFVVDLYAAFAAIVQSGRSPHPSSGDEEVHAEAEAVLRERGSQRQLLRAGGRGRRRAVQRLLQPRRALLLGRHPPHAGRMGGRHGAAGAGHQGLPRHLQLADDRSSSPALHGTHS